MRYFQDPEPIALLFQDPGPTMPEYSHALWYSMQIIFRLALYIHTYEVRIAIRKETFVTVMDDFWEANFGK